MVHIFFVVFLVSCHYCSTISNAFAFDLYKNVKNEQQNAQENIFFSPYSISVAMEIAYEGARGTTADEIAQVFSFQKNAKLRRIESKKNSQLFEKADSYTFLTANALWIEKSFKVISSYRKVIQEWYGAAVDMIDFSHAPQTAEKTINAWVKKQTHGMIETILTPHSLNELTRLVITNAIYFKGTWDKPFDSTQTKDENFFVSETMVKQVPMMHATKEYKYAENDFAQILELDYAGENLSMLILLPKNKNLQGLENQLTVAKFEEWKLELMQQNVHVHIPRMKLDVSYGLVETFKKMGIHKAFDSSKTGANFAGIDGKRDLYIALINHKAALEVHEEGTTAAAATAVVMMMKSMMPRPIQDFRADHPFIVVIQEKTTGTIVFMGRVFNP